LAKRGRTAVRIRGEFVGQPGGGTTVEYRVEFLPVAVVSLAIGWPLGFFAIVLFLSLAHQSFIVLWWLVPLTVLVAAANLWISEMQARWLTHFVRDRLEAT
jgi:protein-S-isoprenylcysteine O-methyltransferase Ste14